MSEQVEARGTTPFNVRCQCGHEWTLAYFPMLMEKAAKVMKRATCPACGETERIFVAVESEKAQ